MKNRSSCGLGTLQGGAQIDSLEEATGDLFGDQGGDCSHSALTADPVGNGGLMDSESLGGENLRPEVLDELVIDVHARPLYGNDHIMEYGHNLLQGNGQYRDHGGMNFGQRLRAARKFAGLTQAQLGGIVGIDQTTISDFERGKSGSSSFCASIAAACGVDPLWLETGEGEMRPKAAEVHTRQSGTIVGLHVAEASAVPEHQLHMVPLVSWVAAGMWSEAIDRSFEDHMLCPERIGPRGFALRVEGDSMTSPYPGAESYPHGTYIYLDPDRAYKSGDPVVARLPGSDEATFKVFIEDGGRCYLKPLNPQYPMIPIDQETHIIATVVGAYRRR